MTTIDFWDDLDSDVLRCFSERHEAMTPAEIGHRVGISDDAARSILTMLAHEGKIRILSVESVAGRSPVDEALTPR